MASERHFNAIVGMNELAPDTQKAIVALGLTRLFQGDMMSASLSMVNAIGILQFIVEGVARRTGHLRPRHQHLRLPFMLPSARPPSPAFVVVFVSSANQSTADR
jgi:hypothetical protein